MHLPRIYSRLFCQVKIGANLPISKDDWYFCPPGNICSCDIAQTAELQNLVVLDFDQHWWVSWRDNMSARDGSEDLFLDPDFVRIKCLWMTIPCLGSLLRHSRRSKEADSFKIVNDDSYSWCHGFVICWTKFDLSRGMAVCGFWEISCSGWELLWWYFCPLEYLTQYKEDASRIYTKLF